LTATYPLPPVAGTTVLFLQGLDFGAGMATNLDTLVLLP
jgi:hypothetical protein